MRWFLLTILPLVGFNLFGQNGYVKVSSDSTIVGFIKRYTSHMDGSRGLEVWRTKKDPQPVRIKMSTIYEYAIKKDTFRILYDFSPFTSENIYFESVEARVVSTGKITLLKIEGYHNPNSISNYTGGGLVPALIDMGLENYSHMYILEEPENDYMRALPGKQQKLLEVLKDFFPERYLTRYKEEKGTIKYSEIPALVKLYNSVR